MLQLPSAARLAAPRSAVPALALALAPALAPEAMAQPDGRNIQEPSSREFYMDSIRLSQALEIRWKLAQQNFLEMVA